MAAALVGLAVIGGGLPALHTSAHAQSLMAGDVPASADDFYTERPGELDGLQNGDVLRERDISMFIYRHWQTRQLAFKSEDSRGRPILATSTVVRPWNSAPNAPIVSYQHYINGLSSNCNPGHTLQHPTLETIQDNAMIFLQIGLREGWVMSIPDHLGANGAYIASRLGAKITLDSMRAVTRSSSYDLHGSPVAMLGYSGGGLPTAWAAAMQPEYAPELNLVGSAQGGFPADVTTMAKILGTKPHPAFGIAFAAALGLEREYPGLVDITPRLTPVGRELKSKIEGACTVGMVVSGFNKSLPAVAFGVSDLESEPGLLEAMRINSIKYFDKYPTTPVFWWHSDKDPLVPYWDAEETAAKWCREGVQVEFQRAQYGEHLVAAVEKLPDAQRWLRDRFAGIPAPILCP